jgi:HSP20 family molecular chaperone IbpA
MKENNIEGILHGMSTVLEKLSELAEKGQKLKEAAYEINRESIHNPHGTAHYAIQELVTHLEETTTDWIIHAHVMGVILNQVQLEADEHTLQLKVIQDQHVLYKEIELPVPCHIQNIHVNCDSGQLQIHCRK